MALPNVTVMEKRTWSSKGSNSLLALNQMLNLSQILNQIPRQTPLPILPLRIPGMDLWRIMSGRLIRNHLQHKDLTATRIFYWLVPRMSMTEILILVPLRTSQMIRQLKGL